ncbi:MAG: DUF4142 domain-containing protein [Acetobacteraceae bacterium]|nr:DUF4142 domain-containing protein [Acetobacteraceae bacterium]
MLRRRLLLPAIFLAAVTARGAPAQVSIMPDTAPRVPPQPGQGLPAEDVRFLRRAVRLSGAQAEAGRLAAEKATSPEVRRLGAEVAKEQTELRQKLENLAKARGIDLQQAETATDASEDSSLAALRQASGDEVDRRFLTRQLGLYTEQAKMYQTAASASPDAELSQIAIAALAALRRHFETARHLGAPYGLKADTVEAPPQY